MYFISACFYMLKTPKKKTDEELKSKNTSCQDPSKTKNLSPTNWFHVTSSYDGFEFEKD